MKMLMSPGVLSDIKKLGNDDRAKVAHVIRTDLSKASGGPGPNRLEIERHLLPWGESEPLWQYRYGDMRIYYDFDKKQNTIVILAVQQKPLQSRIKEVV